MSLNELLPATGDYSWRPADGADDPSGDALRAALAGDEDAIAGALGFLENITPQIAYAVALVDPDMLVLGGALSPVLEQGLTRFAEQLSARLQTPPEVRLSTLDQYAAAVGACRIARDRLWLTLLDQPDGVAPLTRESFDAAISA